MSNNIAKLLPPAGFNLRVGLVGYCPPSKFDEPAARRMIKHAYDKLETVIPRENFALVSGWTNVGIPKIGYVEARRRNWITVGVACARAKEHPLFPVDYHYESGEEWGDETETFLTSIDCLVRIGGGEQSVREAAAVRARNQLVLEYNLPLLS